MCVIGTAKQPAKYALSILGDRMRVLLALPALFLAWTVHAGLPASALEQFLETEMTQVGAPGLSYGVLEDGEIVTGERGTVRLGSDKAVMPKSPFLVGSISKSFTALAVMQLVEAGEVEIDAPVSRYLEDFEHGTAAGDTTIRQLMSHTSGYSTYQGNQWQSDASMTSDALARRVEKIAGIEPDRQPGQSWEYSNINYMLLGRLIEVLSGQYYADYIQINVLDPAGMSNSFVHSTPDDSRLVSGHTPWFTGKRVLDENATGLAAAAQGGIVSTAGDLLLYLDLMMNGEDDVLSAAGKAQMMQPASEVSPNYGFGWFLNTDKGIVSHSGSNPGYEALATMVPAERKAAAILVNSGSGFALKNGFSLQYGFIDRALGIEEAPDLPGSGAIWMFGYVALAPLLFLAAMAIAWRERAKLRSKSGAFGLFSLWFPLVMTIVQAGILLTVLPMLFGAPLEAIHVFQPDIFLLLMATAITGLAWAAVRLVLAYSGAAKA